MTKKKTGKETKMISIGGQALIEGIMFKSKETLSISVRDPKGKIVTKMEKVSMLSESNKFFSLPVVRGVVNLVEMLKIGFEALSYSAEVSSPEEDKMTKKDSIIATILAIALTIGLFIILPLFLTKKVTADQGVIFNLIDGVFRILIFIGYLMLISLMPDVRRVFQYHGAEHMTINCYEDKKDHRKVTAKEVMKYKTLHPRCGTSFLIFVLIISIIIFSIANFQSTIMKILSRVILLPLIAGISYEILRFSAKHDKNILIRAIIYPGLLIQKITTKKPDIRQVEVAVAAFRKHF